MLEKDDAMSLADYIRGASEAGHHELVMDCVDFKAVKCLGCLMGKCKLRTIECALHNAHYLNNLAIITVLNAHCNSNETLRYSKALGALRKDDVSTVMSNAGGSARIIGLLLGACELFDAPESIKALVHICDDEVYIFGALHNARFTPKDSRVAEALEKAVREKYDAKTRDALTLPEWIASFIS